MDKFHSRLSPERAARGEVLEGDEEDYKIGPKVSEEVIRAEKLGPYHRKNNIEKPPEVMVNNLPMGGNGDPYLPRRK